MKKTISMILAIVLSCSVLFILGACNGTDTGDTTAATTKGDGTYEIALVTDVGNIDDKSFNEGAWIGVKQYAEANSKTFAYYRPTEDSTAAREEAIGTAITKGAKVVVCPGSLFEETIYNVQDKYPAVAFLLLDGEPHTADFVTFKTSANVHCVKYQEEQSGYLAGYAAVMDGYTKLGFLGGKDVPAVVRFGFGYVQGADAAAAVKGLAKDKVEIKYWYCGGFAPNDDIKPKMSGWYTEGTEVVFAAGGGIYLSATAAAEAAGKKVIGVDKDQAAESPTIITSAIKALTSSVKISLASFYDSGKKWNADYAGKTAVLGAKEDGVGLPTTATSWKLVNFKVADYEAVLAKLKSGEITVSNAIDKKPATTLVKVDYQS